MRALFIWVLSTALGLTVAVAASSLGFSDITVSDRMANAGRIDVQIDAPEVSLEASSFDAAPEIAPNSDPAEPPAIADMLESIPDMPPAAPSQDELIDEGLALINTPKGEDILRDVFNFYGATTFLQSNVNDPTAPGPLRLVSSTPSNGSGGSGSGQTGMREAAPLQSIFFADDGNQAGSPDASPGLGTIGVAAVPVPTSLLLFGTALAGFGVIHRRRKH
ncbi:MAG: PEP-CTERM sorting domain-containing protein [Paracoccaceae bacterium]|nr:PEP-CTERM sorting domain-containing protein [Paracoccaceae bacterium]